MYAVKQKQGNRFFGNFQIVRLRTELFIYAGCRFMNCLGIMVCTALILHPYSVYRNSFFLGHFISQILRSPYIRRAL